MHQQQQQEQQNGNAWGDVSAEKRGIQVVVFMWQMISVVMDKILVFDPRLSCSNQVLKISHTCVFKQNWTVLLF